MKTSRRFGAATGVIVAAGGLLALAGWTTEAFLRVALLPDAFRMQPLTAFCCILCGLALWLQQDEAAVMQRPVARRVAQGCAWTVLLVGLITFFGEWLLGFDTGLDRLLFPRTILNVDTTQPAGRMAPGTALNFIFMGCALACLDLRGRVVQLLPQMLAVCTLMVAGVALMGELLNVEALYTIWLYAGMALQTPLFFVLMATGMLAIRPDRGVLRPFASGLLGGTSTRRLAVLFLLIPPLVTWLWWQTEIHGLQDRTIALMTGAVANALVFVSVLWWSARSLNRIDAERREKEIAAQAAQARFEKMVEALPHGVVLTDESGVIVMVNRETEQAFGYRREELIGQSVEVLVPELLRDRHRQQRAAYMARPEARRMGQGRELSGRRKDGSEFPVEIGIAPLSTEQGTFVLANVVDITARKQAEDALRESEERFAKAFEESPFPIAITRLPDGVLLDLNDAWLNQFGHTRSEALGKSVFELGIMDAGQFKLLSEAAHAHGGVRDWEMTLHGRSGAAVDVVFSAQCINLAGVPCLLSTLIDISQRKRIEEALRDSEQQLRLMFEHSWDGINLCEAQIEGPHVIRRLIYGNQRFAEMAGRSLEELKACPDLHQLTVDLRPEEERLGFAEKIQRGEVCSGVGGWLRPDGRENYHEWVAIPIQQKDRLLLVGFDRDITARRQAEEALRRAKEAAEAASRAKSDFLSMMSHEIRTPMHALIGILNLLVQDEPNAQRRESLAMAKTSAQSLLNLLNEILMLSQLEARGLHTNDAYFSLEETVQEQIRQFRSNAEAKGITISTHIASNVPCVLHGDPVRLGQVLNNLVGNAVKFTAQGRIEVRVQLTAADERTVELLFAVQDTGIGIDPAHHANIFEAFTQVDSSPTRSYGGVGLGLAICKRIVEALGGSIRVESAPGKGSTFSFTMRFGYSGEQVPRVT